MSKHTPGRWYVQNDLAGNPGVRTRGGFICFSPHITHYSGQDGRYADEIIERAANMQLMATASEMLEVLKYLRSCKNCFVDDIQMLDAIIYKAEGRE